jgi:UPF0755 protein
MMERDPRNNLFLFGALGALFLFSAWLLSAPAGFEAGKIVVIPEGAGSGKIAAILKEEHVIRSTFLFRAFSVVFGARGMKAGEYYFEHSPNALSTAWRISRGDHDIETARITVPEGFTAKEISALFDDRFPLFDNAAFERAAPEGYLFPDTYFVPVSATAPSVTKLMYDNYVRRIFPLTPAIEKSGHSIEEIVTMASLLEAEVKTKEEREIASGILWKRLKMGMALQVDSAQGTYKSPGLPAKPINNPGLVSLEAAIHPATTPYLYFLTDKQGKAHYAKTFDEHQKNIATYLR